jgi:multisubunit Na+/H+ antiporter MnhE subunit
VHDRVDPAALLVAVLVVGIGPVMGEGPWDPLPSILGLIVGAILVLLTWPRKVQGRVVASSHDLEKRLLLAQSLVYGFIVSTVVAWPIQSIIQGSRGRPEGCGWLVPQNCKESAWGNVPLAAAYLSLLVGLILAGVVYAVLVTITRGASDGPAPDDG